MVQFLVTFCGHCAPLFFVAAVVSNRLLAGNGFIGTINVVCRRPGGRGSSFLLSDTPSPVGTIFLDSDAHLDVHLIK